MGQNPSRCGLLTRSCRSDVFEIMHCLWAPWFSYILPSTLVIISALIGHVHHIDYGHSTSQSCRLYVRSSLQTSCGIKHSVLYRVLMLRRSASPTETELRFEYSHMIDEAIEMVTAGKETPKNFVPSISTDDQALP